MKNDDIGNIHEAAVEVSTILEELKFKYCIIGGIALQRWGEPRMTVDVDLTIDAGFGKEREIARKITERIKSRIDDPESFAQANRILLLVTAGEIGVDVSLGAMPFEQRILQRSSKWKLQNLGTLITCSAEDLVVLKAFADRPQDWIDIERVVVRHGSHLNRALVLQELQPLVQLKEEPEILERLNRLFQENL